MMEKALVFLSSKMVFLASASASTLSLIPPHRPSCNNRTWKWKNLPSLKRVVPVSPSFLHSRNLLITCFSSKKKLSFMEQILDYIEGGPKLRKWYGAPDVLSKDEPDLDEEEITEEEDEVRDAVLVAGGDTEIGQMIILSLIVKQIRTKALVKDKRAAMNAFGTYVESIAGDPKDSLFLKRTLKGVRTIICVNEGFLSNLKNWKGLGHVILLSQLSVYKSSEGIQAIMNNNARKLAEQDESVLMASGIPYTIIRIASLNNIPKGQGFSLEEGSAARGSLSKEDAAVICVEALDFVPKRGLLFEVANGETIVPDWKECFAALMAKSEQ